MKIINKFITKLFKIIGIFSIVIQGLNNKYLLKKTIEDKINQDLIELDHITNVENKLDIISEKNWKNLINLINKMKKKKVKYKEILLENNIKIKLNNLNNNFNNIHNNNMHVNNNNSNNNNNNNNNNISTKIILNVEFGNSLNPLYYNSLNSLDYCLLLLSKHFEIYMKNLFELYLDKLNKIKSEIHINSKYYLELKYINKNDIKLILLYIYIFFNDNIFNINKLINNYLLEIKIYGNKYFMPDNFIKQLFLTVLNNEFNKNNFNIEFFRDIYDNIKNCGNKKNIKLLLNKHKYLFKKRIKEIEIILNNKEINIKYLENFIKYLFTKLEKTNLYYNYLNISIKKNPFSILTKGILQINNNRLNNKLVFIFPVRDEIYYQKYKVLKILNDIKSHNLFKKYIWIKDINCELEYNEDNKFYNIIINFNSNISLNSEDSFKYFNLIQIIEVWLFNLLLYKKLLRNKYNNINSNILNNKSSRYYDIILNKLENDFINKLFSYLEINNMIIVIYSNNLSKIRGIDIININNKLKENYYLYIIRKYHTLLYYIKKKILVLFGIKYLIYKEEYYFGTKYLYYKIPNSIINYINKNYKINFQ